MGSNTRSGLEKRHCTFQICFSPDVLAKVKIAIMFRGRRIRIDEKQAYHKDVDVCWQQKVWADTQFSVVWAKNCTRSKENEFILFYFAKI